MTFKNETSDTLEISVPITVQASFRFWIDPDEELTAALINHKLHELSTAEQRDVIRLPYFDGDFSMSILGIERDRFGQRVEVYNKEIQESWNMPEGVEYAPADLVRDAAQDMLAALKDAQEEIRAWRKWAKPGEGPDKPVVTSFVLNKVAAVIAKAEGRANA